MQSFTIHKPANDVLEDYSRQARPRCFEGGGGGLCIQSAGDLWDDFYKMLHFNRINVFHGQ